MITFLIWFSFYNDQVGLRTLTTEGVYESMLVFNITPEGGYRRPFPNFPWIRKITTWRQNL
jgi:hypothetical protein